MVPRVGRVLVRAFATRDRAWVGLLPDVVFGMSLLRVGGMFASTDRLCIPWGWMQVGSSAKASFAQTGRLAAVFAQIWGRSTATQLRRVRCPHEIVQFSCCDMSVTWKTHD